MCAKKSFITATFCRGAHASQRAKTYETPDQLEGSRTPESRNSLQKQKNSPPRPDSKFLNKVPKNTESVGKYSKFGYFPVFLWTVLPLAPGPAFDLFFTYFDYLAVLGSLARLQFRKLCLWFSSLFLLEFGVGAPVSQIKPLHLGTKLNLYVQLFS